MVVAIDFRCMNCSVEHRVEGVQVRAEAIAEEVRKECPRCKAVNSQLVIGSVPKGAVALDVKVAGWVK